MRSTLTFSGVPVRFPMRATGLFIPGEFGADFSHRIVGSFPSDSLPLILRFGTINVPHAGLRRNTFANRSPGYFAGLCLYDVASKDCRVPVSQPLQQYFDGSGLGLRELVRFPVPSDFCEVRRVQFIAVSLRNRLGSRFASRKRCRYPSIAGRISAPVHLPLAALSAGRKRPGASIRANQRCQSSSVLGNGSPNSPSHFAISSPYACCSCTSSRDSSFARSSSQVSSARKSSAIPEFRRVP